MALRTSARIGITLAATAAGAYVASRPTLVPWPGRMRPAVTGVLGGLSGATAFVAAGAVGLRGGPAPTLASRARRLVGAGMVAGTATGAVRVAKSRASARLEGVGREIDHGFATPPTLETVSGGPGSLVDYATVGREGARFLSSSVPAGVIEQVTGRTPSMSGIRVFVGYDTAPTPQERVDLALAELRRTGAYDRSYLLIGAPAGSGYANSTPVDVLEIMTGGDVAAVAVGYGLLPSFLSLDRVPIASQTQRLLIDGITADLAGRDRRPLVLLYGESLGARVQQAAIPAGSSDLDRIGAHAALWVGTPGGPQSVAFHAAVSAESITLDRPEQIPERLQDARPRVWFLEHDGDPVVRFEPTIAFRRPPWLAQRPRGRNVPEQMVWAPGITWAQVLVDTLFATNVKPGQFESRGHDYRADLGATVTAAYGLSADSGTSARLEAALRALEVARAERIGEA